MSFQIYAAPIGAVWPKQLPLTVLPPSSFLAVVNKLHSESPIATNLTTRTMAMLRQYGDVLPIEVVAVTDLPHGDYNSSWMADVANLQRIPIDSLISTLQRMAQRKAEDREADGIVDQIAPLHENILLERAERMKGDGVSVSTQAIPGRRQPRRSSAPAQDEEQPPEE